MTNPILQFVERLAAEGLIGLSTAASFYGRGRQGKATCPGTLTRHYHDGITLPDGTVVKLEAIRVGRKLMTSKAAVLRFLAAQQIEQQETQVTAPSRSESKSARASEAANRELIRRGA